MTHKKYFLIILFIIPTTHTISLLEIARWWNTYNAQNRRDLMNLWLPEQQQSIQEQKDPSAYTFAALAGEIPQDIKEIPEFIKNSEKFERLGAKMPRGIILYGPPGTGKTSLARALAGECDAAFFSASGSQFIEMYVGVGPQRIRELFDKARAAIASQEYSRAFIYIDEIDAIGTSRALEGNSEYRNTLNELLNQMDGFNKNNGITVLASTNSLYTLDPALLRPGRFDRHVEIPLPSEQSRQDILRYYASKIVYDQTVDFEEIARMTRGCSGADLEHLVNEAAILAVRTNSAMVMQEHFKQAAQKILTQKKIR
ncbi:MAG: AAA family ATPase [Candidatus Babeliaceae bacterium]|jgi:cell division protease FtsH